MIRLAPLSFVFEVTPEWLLVAGIVAIGVLGVAWFALKFWLASTRPANIPEVRTPNLDRINRRALERMSKGDEEDLDEEAPEGLKEAVPEGDAAKGAEA